MDLIKHNFEDSPKRQLPAVIFPSEMRSSGPMRSIGEAIQRAVDSVDNAALKPLSRAATSPVSQARAVLALLLNCYVHQIYSSKNAATLAARDPEFPWLWWEDFPDGYSLKRFREENTVAIHHCLSRVLEHLAAQKKADGNLTGFDYRQLAEEASRRISMAAFVDGMELKGEYRG